MKFSTFAVASLFLAADASDAERNLRRNKRGICKKDVPNVGPFLQQLFYNMGSHVPDFDNLHKIGAHTARICEAADASVTGAPMVDGEDGDVDFPHGNLKVLATVGEVSTCDESQGQMIVGVPDGLGVMLSDDKTVRAVVQSESYGPLRYESYPFPVNNGAATFTGSHVQYVDYDRRMLANFMSHSGPASAMVKGAGELIEHAYNLKGEPIGPRNTSGPTTVGTHYSNTDPEGNYIVGSPIQNGADWLMQSLCSSHLELKHQWGPGIGLEDNTFLTVEEWMTYVPDPESLVGLPAHAIDIATKTAWAVGAMTNGGFEKIVEINSQHKDYVIFSPSGYNGSFGGYDKVIANRNANYSRVDGKPFVHPQNVVPARIYIGVKGKMEDGSDAPADDYLARNGLRYGKVYGFATDMSTAGPTGGLWRDAFHKDPTTAVNGAKVDGVFTPISWQWDGKVKDFSHDGSWDFQDQPPLHVGTNNYYWNAAGNDAGGCKTEHNSPDPREGISGFVQTSTCGYFGHYYLNNIKELLDGLSGTELPGDISSTYYMYQGETDITSQINLGGKGQYADGQSALTNCDSTACTKKTFEDPDGFEILEDNGELYAVIQEDSGNKYGERMFITDALQHSGTPVKYHFVAMSGGSSNSRMKAGVAVPKGTSGGASSHEFSGVADMSGLLLKSGMWSWAVGANDEGYKVRAANRAVPVNEKGILIGLQAHNFDSGIIADMQGDRGGQWFMYQPDI